MGMKRLLGHSFQGGMPVLFEVTQAFRGK